MSCIYHSSAALCDPYFRLEEEAGSFTPSLPLASLQARSVNQSRGRTSLVWQGAPRQHDGQSPQLGLPPVQRSDSLGHMLPGTLQFQSGSLLKMCLAGERILWISRRAARACKVWDGAGCVPGYLPVRWHPEGQAANARGPALGLARAVAAQDVRCPWQHPLMPASLQRCPSPTISQSHTSLIKTPKYDKHGVLGSLRSQSAPRPEEGAVRADGCAITPWGPPSATELCSPRAWHIPEAQTAS